MQPFKLLSLPRIPREIIAKQMEKFDLLNLILTSKKTQTLTKFNYNPVCCRIYLTKTHYQVEVHFGWFGCLKWKVCTEESDRKDPHLDCREEVGSIVIGDMLLERNSKITALDKMFTIAEPSDRFKVFQQITDFLFAMFPCKNDCLHFDFEVISEPDEFIRWKAVRNTEFARIDGGTEQQVKEYLDVVQDVQIFYLGAQLSHGFEHEKLFSTSVDRVVATTPWMSRDTFFKLDRPVLFTNCSSLQPSDLIEYIQKWLNGGYSNLEKLTLQFKNTNQLGEFLFAVVETFNPVPDVRMEDPMFRIGQAELVDLRTSRFFRRDCDGKMLSIVFTYHLRMYMIVLDGETIPEYSIPHGKAVYQSIKWPNTSSIKKLIPRIFENDEDAEREMQLKVNYF